MGVLVKRTLPGVLLYQDFNTFTFLRNEDRPKFSFVVEKEFAFTNGSAETHVWWRLVVGTVI